MNRLTVSPGMSGLASQPTYLSAVSGHSLQLRSEKRNAMSSLSLKLRSSKCSFGLIALA